MYQNIYSTVDNEIKNRIYTMLLKLLEFSVFLIFFIIIQRYIYNKIKVKTVNNAKQLL